MIVGSRHKGLKRLYERGDRSKFPANMADEIEEILANIDGAQRIEDLDLPSYRLHELSGNRKGEWSITVRANWRIVFIFANGNADNLNFEDYH